MEQQKQTLATDDPEKTLVSPRFDGDAISHARPAAHLGEVDAATPPPPQRLRQAANELTSSRLALALVLVSMLAAGVIGALATMLYYRHAVSEPPAAAQEQQDVSENDARDGHEDMTQQRTAPAAEEDKRPLIKSGGDQDEAQGEGAHRPQGDEHQRSSLREALDGWIATTNARDINRQKEFYMPKVDAFYRSRNVSRDAVLADKGRAFDNADLIDVRAGQPEVTINPDGLTATMRFRKRYAIRHGQQDRRGEVLQELRWRRTVKGWKIMSERDVKVIQ